jgi:FkbM family methyltransferase
MSFWVRVKRRMGERWFVTRWRIRPAVGQPRMTVRELLRLLYPSPLPRDLDLERKAFRAVGSNRIRDLRSIRRVLATLDHHSAPSPISVRFSPDDVVEVDLEGMSIALDSADISVSEPMIRDREYEPHITNVLRQLLRPGMTFLDIGANVGYYSLLGASLVGPGGRVIGIEPNSENCRLILRSLELNHYSNVAVLPVALAEETGWSYFVNHLGSNGSLSHSPRESLSGWGQIVPTLRGDSVLQGPIDVIKMDVEGAEARVVAGLASLIEVCKPVIVTEVSHEMLTRVSGSGLAEFLGWFTDRGYGCALIGPGSDLPADSDDVQALVAAWGDSFRIENVLLRPRAVG